MGGEVQAHRGHGDVPPPHRPEVRPLLLLPGWGAGDPVVGLALRVQPLHHLVLKAVGGKAGDQEAFGPRAGKFTLRSTPGGSPRSPTARAMARAQRAASWKSRTSPEVSRLKAMEGIPKEALGGRGHRPRVGEVQAQVHPQVDPRDHQVWPAQKVDAQDHAVGGRPVHPVGGDLPEAGALGVLETQGAADGDPVAHGRLLHVRGHHEHLPQRPHGEAQGLDARGEDAVVVGDQDAHGPSMIEKPPTRGL